MDLKISWLTACKYVFLFKEFPSYYSNVLTDCESGDFEINWGTQTQLLKKVEAFTDASEGNTMH